MTTFWRPSLHEHSTAAKAGRSIDPMAPFDTPLQGQS